MSHAYTNKENVVFHTPTRNKNDPTRNGKNELQRIRTPVSRMPLGGKDTNVHRPGNKTNNNDKMFSRNSDSRNNKHNNTHGSPTRLLTHSPRTTRLSPATRFGSPVKLSIFNELASNSGDDNSGPIDYSHVPPESIPVKPQPMPDVPLDYVPIDYDELARVCSTVRFVEDRSPSPIPTVESVFAGLSPIEDTRYFGAENRRMNVVEDSAEDLQDDPALDRTTAVHSKNENSASYSTTINDNLVDGDGDVDMDRDNRDNILTRHPSHPSSSNRAISVTRRIPEYMKLTKSSEAKRVDRSQINRPRQSHNATRYANLRHANARGPRDRHAGPSRKRIETRTDSRAASARPTNPIKTPSAVPYADPLLDVNINIDDLLTGLN